MINITFPDGNVRQYAAGTTALDVAKSISEGLARVDFFLDRHSGKFYFNEVNTLPGFTSVSMYAKMWDASGLAYLPASDEVAVGDYQDLGGNQSGGEVLIFPRTISGAPVASRRIAGPSTQLGSFVNSLAVDPAHNELFVLVTDADARSRIVVFPVGADGNVAPLRVIGGNNTRMTNAGGLDYYAFRDELLVASGAFNSAATRVLGFARTAQGNIAPSRDISGSNTGVSAASGWLAVVGVPLAQVFGDGFE